MASIAVNDANLFQSPYNWYRSGSTYLRSNNPGAYLKFTTSVATAVTVHVDVSVMDGVALPSNEYPVVSYQVDGGALTRAQLVASQTDVVVSTGLSAVPHEYVFWFTAMGFAEDTWTTPVMALVVTGLTISAGALATPTLKTDRMVVFGDSNLEGQEALGAGETVAHQDAIVAWGIKLSNFFDAEVGIIPFGGAGYNQDGTPPGNVPKFTTSYSLYSNGLSRLSGGLFTPVPTRIIVGYGQNDADDAATSTAVATAIGALRTAAPLAPIYCLTPPFLTNASRISAGVTAAADANAFYVTHGVDLSAYAQTPLDAHMSADGHIVYAGLNAGLLGVPMSTFIFNAGMDGLSSGGTVAWASDTIKARLVDSAVTPSIDADDLTGLTAVGTDETLAGKTKVKNTTDDRIVFDADNPVYASPGTGDEVGSVVVYKFVTNDGDSIPLFCLECTPFTTDGTAVTVNFASTGIGYTQE